MDEQLDFLKLIASRLDAGGISYMITGSMAMAMYTQPRMTRDIDLVVELNSTDVDRLVELFKGDCYIDNEAVREAIDRSLMFNVIHKEWTTKADFIVRKDEEYRAVEFARRRKVTIAEASAWLVSIEDLILSKLVWRKESLSELQLRDVRELIATNPRLDWDYLLKWAAQLGVAQALGETGKNA